MNKKYNMKQEVKDRLEWHDSGDDVTYEYWRDTKTGDVYKVPLAPLELVREFDDALNITQKAREENYDIGVTEEEAKDILKQELGL